MSQINPEHKNLTKLGEGGTHPNRSLETFPNRNPERDYVVELKTNEFTCICPKTGQPDFAENFIRYVLIKKLWSLNHLNSTSGLSETKELFTNTLPTDYLMIL